MINQMRVFLAYISVILIWATTPLAIKWSGEGPGFLFAVTGRMSIGAVCITLLLIITRQKLIWHKRARRAYLVIALQIYAAMLSVYWSAQFIPSGWISVIFGLSPLITALLAAIWLGERSLSFAKIVSYFLGLSGLLMIFGSAIQYSETAEWGIIGVLLAAFLQSASAVWVKRINAKLPALSQVAGGLLFALPAYLVSWYVVDGQWPATVIHTALFSIVYLGIIATVFGFAMYYYVLTHLPATRVALITLVTPVLSLLLGHGINHEPITFKIAAGTTLILTGLLLHTFFDRQKGFIRLGISRHHKN